MVRRLRLAGRDTSKERLHYGGIKEMVPPYSDDGLMKDGDYLRGQCHRGCLKKYIKRGLVWKPGKDWLVTAQAMREVYGPIKK